jgi:iron complex transport system permease protein
VGGALAIAGAGFQVILRNPLAEPYTLGATGGAAVGAVLAISVPGLASLFGPSVQIFALAGAAVSLGLVYRLARRPHGLSMSTLLLAGVTVSILCGGLIMFIRYFAAPEDHVRTTLWLMGGLGVVGYREIATLIVLLLPGLAMLLTQTSALNHLSLGDQMAAGHGVEVSDVQRMAFLGGGVLTAGAVSVAGPIGFVGLIVPHAVRRLSGYDQRVVLPASFLLGGAFLTVCDTAARLIFAGRDLPVGVVTALVGGPLFIKILLGRRR